MAKIGLSLGQCVKDIVDGLVDIDQVLVVVTRTNFNPRIDADWNSVWESYCGRFGSIRGSSLFDESKYRNVVLALLNSGKLHQPRQFGAQYWTRSDYAWLEAVLPSIELEKNPAAKLAWDKFQTVADLTNVKLTNDLSSL